MKRINHFKPNVVPTSEHAQRQWKWNFLRKLKRKMIAEGKTIVKEDFVAAGSGIGLWPKKHPYKSRRQLGKSKAKSRKQTHYDNIRKPNRGDQSGYQP